LQGTACYPGAADALHSVVAGGLLQGLVADAQCFTPVQLQRGLTKQCPDAKPAALFDPELCIYSYEQRGRKPSERLFRALLEVLSQRHIRAEEVLHIGSRIEQDIVPARRLGLRTGLFAGDRASLRATAEQLKGSTSRPDVLLTELGQVRNVVFGPES
jgi:hypothetical protein